MDNLAKLFRTGPERKLSRIDREHLAGEFGAACDLSVYPDSLIVHRDVLYAMARRPDGEKTVLRASGEGEGEAVTLSGTPLRVEHLPTDHATAELLRKEVDFLNPRPSGLQTSAGLGDRLGLATPGHLRAVEGSGIFPVLSQQSIREMERTGRTPDDVMDCATYGVLEAGWTGGFGSDADHLKTPEDVDYTMAAGFTMFTIDPSAYVVNEADEMDAEQLESAVSKAPWEALETTAAETQTRYGEKALPVPGVEETFTGEALARAIVKYGGAVAHAASMARYIHEAAAGRPVEIEVSVDETESPTTVLEHYYVAAELRRLGVTWVSLAPRFLGRFEKGVDYIGDIAAFEASYAKHCKVAEAFGPYKISIHSGSDKFSIYGICAKHAEGRVHLKTAGTSYLEALRAIAKMDRELFLRILAFANERYETDKATYHVSADSSKIISAEQAADMDEDAILDQFDTRQALHVTFGSVLTADDGKRFKKELLEALREHEEEHYAILARHIGRHLDPLRTKG